MIIVSVSCIDLKAMQIKGTFGQDVNIFMQE